MESHAKCKLGYAFRPFAGRAVVFPDMPTYRRNPAISDWSTTIDGAVVATVLAATATAEGLEAIPHVQHRPVLVHLGLRPSFHEALRWDVGTAIQMGAWEQDTAKAFSAALSSDIDLAWRIWQDASGASHSQVVRQPSGGSWNAGARARELAGLWKTYRRQRFDARFDAADHTLACISEIIDDANVHRIREWRERILTRGGAAKWVRTKASSLTAPILPKFGAAAFSLRDLARALGLGLATRWNSGVFLVRHLPGFRLDFSVNTLTQQGCASTVLIFLRVLVYLLILPFFPMPLLTCLLPLGVLTMFLSTCQAVAPGWTGTKRKGWIGFIKNLWID